MQVYKSGVRNYYGEVQLQKHDEKFYLTLESWDDEYGVEVSEEFAKAFIKEFTKEKTVVSINQ